jgi:hypothetical protein
VVVVEPPLITPSPSKGAAIVAIRTSAAFATNDSSSKSTPTRSKPCDTRLTERPLRAADLTTSGIAILPAQEAFLLDDQTALDVTRTVVPGFSRHSLSSKPSRRGSRTCPHLSVSSGTTTAPLAASVPSPVSSVTTSSPLTTASRFDDTGRSDTQYRTSSTWVTDKCHLRAFCSLFKFAWGGVDMAS